MTQTKHHQGSEGQLSARPNAVDRPPHYTSSAVEPIDAIEAWELDFHLGNAVKYIARAGKKDPAKVVEDLQKAAWYLNRAINRRAGFVGS